MIRDPRDVVVSGYYSHRHSHPLGSWVELAEHRRRLQAVTPEEGLLLEIDFSARLRTEGIDLEPFRSLSQWDYARDDILELRYEEIVERPA